MREAYTFCPNVLQKHTHFAQVCFRSMRNLPGCASEACTFCPGVLQKHTHFARVCFRCQKHTHLGAGGCKKSAGQLRAHQHVGLSAHKRERARPALVQEPLAQRRRHHVLHACTRVQVSARLCTWVLQSGAPVVCVAPHGHVYRGEEPHARCMHGLHRKRTSDHTPLLLRVPTGHAFHMHTCPFASSLVKSSQAPRPTCLRFQGLTQKLAAGSAGPVLADGSKAVQREPCYGAHTMTRHGCCSLK